MIHTAYRILAVLKELCEEDQEVMQDCYGIDVLTPDDAPLDAAIAAWVAAGSPMPAASSDLSALGHVWKPDDNPNSPSRWWCPHCLISTAAPYDALCPDLVGAALRAKENPRNV